MRDATIDFEDDATSDHVVLIAGDLTGTARTAATIMALGLDPRFDLTHAYFLVAGISAYRWLRGQNLIKIDS